MSLLLNKLTLIWINYVYLSQLSKGDDAEDGCLSHIKQRHGKQRDHNFLNPAWLQASRDTCSWSKLACLGVLKLSWKYHFEEEEFLCKRFALLVIGLDRALFRFRYLKLFYRSSPAFTSDHGKLVKSNTAENKPDKKQQSIESNWLILSADIPHLNVTGLTTVQKRCCLFKYFISRNVEYALLPGTLVEKIHDDKMAYFLVNSLFSEDPTDWMVPFRVWLFWNG